MEQAARKRLLEAMLTELAANGYGGMKTTEVLVLTGVSEADFEAEFGDKDGCLFAAYEQLTEGLSRKTTRACAEGGERWPQRVGHGLSTLLDELAARPPMARAAVRSFPAIGPEARDRYQDFVEGFAPLLREGREFSEAGAELPAEVEMLAVGAAEAIVVEEVEAGRAAALPALGPAILFSVLVPFLGPEAAGAEMERAARTT